MAIATGTAIALGLTVAGGAAQAISGASRAAKARRKLENFQRQELRNVTEGMRVSTLGAELQSREAARRFATSVDALQSSGVRGVVGGLGRQELIQQQQSQRIAADLDRQQAQIEMLRARDEQRIQGMKEQRDLDQMGFIAGERAAAQQMAQQGLQTLGSAASQALTIGMEAGSPKIKDNVALSNTTYGSQLVSQGKTDFKDLYIDTSVPRGLTADLSGLKAPNQKI